MTTIKDETRDEREQDEPAAPPLPIRRLLSLARPQAARLVAATLFLALGSGMTLLYPRVVKELVDGALIQEGLERLEAIDRTALFLGVVLMLQSVAVALRHYLFGVAGLSIIRDLRGSLYASIVDQEIGFFDKHRTGELVSRLSNDAGVLRDVVTSDISVILRDLLLVVGGVAMLFWISPSLTLLMLLVVPPVILGSVFFGRRIEKVSKETQDELAATTHVAEESIAGIRTVRAFSRETHEVGRYRGALGKHFDMALRGLRLGSWFLVAVMTTTYASLALVFWYGGRLVADGGLSVGSLVQFLLYTMTVAMAVGGLGETWTGFTAARGASRRVFELLDREAKVPQRGGRTLASIEGRVHFRGVEFAYPERSEEPVLRGLELELEPHRTVALVGPSGAGKSTVAALLARFYDPISGGIELDGTPLTELDPSWLRTRMGIVSQEPVLFSTTIEENIRYGRPTATDEELEAASRAAHAHEFISRLPEGYGTEVGERGVRLSGGQRQRIAIARALLADPRLLVLDEATSALDAESEHLVQEALDRLRVGRTTLVIAHRLSTVRDADRVVVLDEGRVVESGTHESLLEDENGLYRRLVERQWMGS